MSTRKIRIFSDRRVVNTTPGSAITLDKSTTGLDFGRLAGKWNVRVQNAAGGTWSIELIHGDGTSTTHCTALEPDEMIRVEVIPVFGVRVTFAGTIGNQTAIISGEARR